MSLARYLTPESNALQPPVQNLSPNGKFPKTLNCKKCNTHKKFTKTGLTNHMKFWCVAKIKNPGHPFTQIKPKLSNEDVCSFLVNEMVDKICGNLDGDCVDASNDAVQSVSMTPSISEYLMPSTSDPLMPSTSFTVRSSIPDNVTTSTCDTITPRNTDADIQPEIEIVPTASNERSLITVKDQKRKSKTKPHRLGFGRKKWQHLKNLHVKYPL